MENLATLLVSFMFITILVLGIAGILTELADVVRHAGARPRDNLLLGWTILLLFAYFDMFWHTADIALLEDWTFGLFLFAEAGPVLLLFATQIALGAATEEPQAEAPAVLNRGRFFAIFALVQLWSVLAGFVLGVGFTFFSALMAIIAAICVILAATNQRRVHVLGLACVALLYVAGAILGN